MLYPIIISIVVFLSLPLTTAHTDVFYISPVDQVSATPIEVIEPNAQLRSELVPICTCESGQGTGEPQHFNIHTGEVLRGEINSSDIGLCQINLYYHQAAAEEMGVDIFTEQGNIEYANNLYENEGSKPWGWSKPCHGK